MQSHTYAVIGLHGAVEATFRTRANASILAETWNKETDVIGQDLEDRAFCARFGLPFMPRRYFVMKDAE